VVPEWGDSLPAKRQPRAGRQPPERRAQVADSAAPVATFPAHGVPVSSVATKKEEVGGDFKDPGRDWGRHGQPGRVRLPDFAESNLGTASADGIAELPAPLGWGSGGLGHATAAVAVATSRRRGQNLGPPS
jgi:hypothetical protein